jgi:stress-induced morphogen
MPLDPQTIETLIKENIPNSEVQIQDLRGDEDHYAAHVKSPAFAGKSRVQQHQMVYQALQGKVGDELHALALQTSVPESE